MTHICHATVWKVRKSTLQRCARLHAYQELGCSPPSDKHFCCQVLRIGIPISGPEGVKTIREVINESLQVRGEIVNKNNAVRQSEPNYQLSDIQKAVQQNSVQKVKTSEENAFITTTKQPLFLGGQRRGVKESNNVNISEVISTNLTTTTTPAPSNFSLASCRILKVPCRFVNDHPCCEHKLPLAMVARARAMDGSADLKWRKFKQDLQSGRTLIRRNSFNNIPYTHTWSKREVSAPVYYYRNQSPENLKTILSLCWRISDISCLRNRHICCYLVSNPGPRLPNDNVLTRWLNLNQFAQTEMEYNQ